MNRVADAHERVDIEWTQLQSTLRDLRTVWSDSVADEFEKRFIAPLEADIPQFLRALESLRDELRAAERELR